MAAFIASSTRRMFHQPPASSLPYTFGRFATVRTAYGHSIKLLESMGAVHGLPPNEVSIFGGHEVEAAARSVSETAHYGPLRVDQHLVEELVSNARKAPLRHWGSKRVFTADDVVGGRFENGQPAIIADVIEARNLPAARAVALDPFILEVGRRVLSYSPMGVDVRILYSFATDATEAERDQAGQTYRYHFDVHSWRFLYANFYLTPTDHSSGAHEMIDGSHRTKPLRWLFSSAYKNDDEIEQTYRSDLKRTIEGSPGVGFLQDSSCYHRALAPRSADRIMLHLRYY